MIAHARASATWRRRAAPGPAHTPTSTTGIVQRRRRFRIRRFWRLSAMTEQQARTAANVVMAAGAAGALVYILRKPPLRRLAFSSRIPGSEARLSSGPPPSCGRPGSRAARTRVSARPWRPADVTGRSVRIMSG